MGNVMCENFEKIKSEVEEFMKSNFTSYKFDFMEDPEDESVIYINLYDVADADVQEFKRLIRANIRDRFRKDVLIVPAIFTHAETEQCYPDNLREIIRVSEPDATLHEDIAIQLHNLIAEHEVVRPLKFGFRKWAGMVSSVGSVGNSQEEDEYVRERFDQNIAA